MAAAVELICTVSAAAGAATGAVAALAAGAGRGALEETAEDAGLDMGLDMGLSMGDVLLPGVSAQDAADFNGSASKKNFCGALLFQGSIRFRSAPFNA